MAELKPAYLVCGDDEVRHDDWRARVRARARSEGDSSSFEVLKGDQLSADALVEAVSALTLAVGRRYVMADGIERWSDRGVASVAEALRSLPPETVVVMIAPGKPPAALAKAVEAIGGEVHTCVAPKPARYPHWIAERAADLELSLSGEAAEVLLERIGHNQQRLLRELEKLAIYSGGEGALDADTVQALTTTATEARAWELADAVVEGDRARALSLTEDLRAKGEETMHILFALLRQLRNSYRAWAMSASGKSMNEIQSALRVPPFVAKRIVAQARRADGERLEQALTILADLDYAVRGAGRLDNDSALTLAVRRAAGVAS
jgi:DNA polymerase-3 subunit delta